VSKSSREVFAGYEIDELMMQIVIRLPVDYPLKIATVESVNRVGIKENKWANFIMITQGVIAFTVSHYLSRQFCFIIDSFSERLYRRWLGHLPQKCGGCSERTR
jgi:hypothetical protein